jgi:hypothetical protein
MRYSYPDLFRATMTGDLVEARGLRTRELLGAGISVPASALVQRPGLNRTLGYMELLQLVGGIFDLTALKRVAPRAKHALFTEQMAYGPRTLWYEYDYEVDQLEHVAEELCTDPSSRRAVVQLRQPADAAYPAQAPCTSCIQFLVRRGGLYTIVTMRSWDLWWGLPYDLIMFCGLAQLMGRCLGVPAIDVQVNAGSAHVYEQHWGNAPLAETDYLEFADDVPRDWSALRRWARALVADTSWVYATLPAGVLELTHDQWVAKYLGVAAGG